MRVVLIILIGFLYFSRTEVCLFFYPYDHADPTTHDLWDGFLMAKYIGYQLLVFLTLLIVIISQFRLKRTNFFILLPTVALSIFVAFNIVDKAQGIDTYHFHDIVIAFGSFIVCREIYLKHKRNV